ncbi:TPA: ABC transporter ATP-binding protein [Candidatus Bathyarchaeota archaeon]|nr:ABC transporter ATP-binding protein [Candidatus Bathyarchaeota archaeon]
MAELKNVTKTYGDKIVLDSINLKINKGEILALLGPNGSGKTTILKIFSLLEPPTNGEVTISGESVNTKNTERIRMLVTLVFQKTTLFSTSVYNNVSYGLKIRKMPKETCNQAVKKALELVKLEGFENRSASKLSGGEQQRVALARALVLDPTLLLLDEPTANLDPKNASILEEIIAKVNRELKTTIVLATHNMFQAKKLPHRIALISEGKITEIGQPVDIFNKLSRDLVSFAALENTFKGKAHATGKGTTVINIGNGVKIEVTAQRTGEATLFVNPQDIILSKTALESSARNVFKGRITEISDLGTLVKLTVNVGNPFTIQITKRSFAEMGLNLNAQVYVAFKASSVQVL